MTGGLRALLDRREWTYVLSLLVPFAAYDLALKALGVLSWSGDPGPFVTLALVRSDLMFVSGYALLWVGVFALAKRGPPRWVAVVLFHAATMVLLAFATCARAYFEATGSTLGYGVVALALAEFGDVWPVVASEVSWPAGVLLIFALSYAALGPHLLTRAFARWRRWPVPAGTPGSSPLGALGLCLLALLVGSLALPPGDNPAGASDSFVRDEVVNVVASEAEYARFRRTLADVDAAPRRPPAGTSLARTARTQRRNVVLIHLESVRARSVAPYNGDAKSTPFLNELAKSSLLAERAYAVVPHTSKAVTSVNCGIEPHLVREITEAEPGGVPARCLAGLLGERGYDTVLFQSATEEFEDRRRLVKNLGYEEFHPLEAMDKTGFEESNYFGYEDGIMLGPSKEWLEEHGDGPFLAAYLGVTGHHDYRKVTREGARGFAEGDGLDRYRSTVRYLDSYVRDLVEQYKELGLYEKTVFVVYGDHGEGFGEHGLYQHDNTIYEEGVRVPLLVHDPRRFGGGERVGTLTNELDVLPTVLDLMGYEVAGGEYPGRSLLAPPDEDRTLFFGCFDYYRCLASLEGTEKYIYFFGDRPEEVYDLSSDPLERRNLAGELSKEELKERRTRVLSWFSTVNAMYEG